MQNISASQVNNIAPEVSKVDVKSLAYDIYEVKFGQILADWMEEGKDVYFHGTKIPADRKWMTEGVFAFNKTIQEYGDVFTMAMNIFNTQNQDVQKIGNMF